MSRHDYYRVGLLIVGHGTRSERGQAEFFQCAELVGRLLSPHPVAAAFLELAPPTILEGVAQLAAQGVRRVVVMPLLLLAAGHAKDDIPAAIAQATAAFPGIDFVVAEHLGRQKGILRLSTRRFAESLCDRFSTLDTLCLLVGRGSSDPSSQAEMRRFATVRLACTPLGRMEIAYLAMAEPSLDVALATVAEMRYPQIIVQPHLLFYGELLDSLAARIDAFAGDWPGLCWRIAGHLGPAAELAEAVIGRFWEAQARAPYRRLSPSDKVVVR